MLFLFRNKFSLKIDRLKLGFGTLFKLKLTAFLCGVHFVNDGHTKHYKSLPNYINNSTKRQTRQSPSPQVSLFYFIYIHLFYLYTYKTFSTQLFNRVISPFAAKSEP